MLIARWDELATGRTTLSFSNIYSIVKVFLSIYNCDISCDVQNSGIMVICPSSHLQHWQRRETAGIYNLRGEYVNLKES